jgi:hypothetical protein
VGAGIMIRRGCSPIKGDCVSDEKRTLKGFLLTLSIIIIIIIIIIIKVKVKDTDIPVHNKLRTMPRGWGVKV